MARWRSAGRLLAAALGAGVLGAGAWRYAARPVLPPLPAVELAPTADPAMGADLRAARAAVEARPRSAAAWGDYGLTLKAYEQDAEAVVCWQTAAALDPADGRWAYLAGRDLARTDPPAAVPWLERAGRGELPAEAREPARDLLAETLLAADRPADALAALGPALPKGLRGRLIAARAALAGGDERRAAEILSELASAPDAPRQVFQLQAEVYQRQNRPAFAQAASKRIAGATAAEFPDPLADPIPRRNRSRTGRLDEALRLLRGGRAEEAARALESLRANSPDAKPHLGLAECYQALGDAGRAAGVLREASRLFPQDAAAHYRLGLLAFGAGEELWQAGRRDQAGAAFREALAPLGRALELDPNFAKALALKGIALARFLGRPDEGVACLRRFAELRPELADAHLYLGEALSASNNPAAARESLKRAADLAPPNDRRAAEALVALEGRKPGG